MSEPALVGGGSTLSSGSVSGGEEGSERPAVRAILAAASTGGPEALASFLTPCVESAVRVPVFVVQHLLPGFTSLFTDKLSAVLSRCCVEPADGEAVRSGQIYVAPGGHHMSLVRDQGSLVRVCLDRGAAVNFCRPSADPLFESAAGVYGCRVLVAVLTGMGSDGLNGARSVVASGGLVCAQDESSSAVWGMPGGVIKAGLAVKEGSPRSLGVWASRMTMEAYRKGRH